MSIDSKIAEIMEESKLAGLVLENEEEIVEENIIVKRTSRILSILLILKYI